MLQCKYPHILNSTDNATSSFLRSLVIVPVAIHKSFLSVAGVISFSISKIHNFFITDFHIAPPFEIYARVSLYFIHRYAKSFLTQSKIKFSTSCDLKVIIKTVHKRLNKALFHYHIIQIMW